MRISRATGAVHPGLPSIVARLSESSPSCIRLTLSLTALALLVPHLSSTGLLAADPASKPAVLNPAHTPQFESDIRPIFREFCFDCHGATSEVEGGLDLRLVKFLLSGGDSGPAIVPGKADHSYLWEMVSTGQMPPGEAHLPADKLAVIQQWIDAGSPTLRPEPDSIGAGIPLSVEDRSYWAYQPIERPELPSSAKAAEQQPIDRLLQAAMPAGLTFAPQASRDALIQRAYITLIGLPPTAEEHQRWRDHDELCWFDDMLEALLASPHYGERWARHWLDVAGYADSEGSTNDDVLRPWAWKYRDYVIRALNADKPFDRFIAEQLAGDELAGAQQGDWTQQQIELLTATGFLRNVADGTGSGDNSPEGRNKVINDALRVLGSALLGSSVHCAQCHDHRYDPISQADYTALRSVLEPALDWQQWRTPTERLISLTTAADRQLAADIEAQIQPIAAERQTQQDVYLAQALEQELLKYEDSSLRESLRLAYQTADAQRSDEQRELLKSYPSLNISPGVLYQYLPAAAEELKKFDQRIADLRNQKPQEEFISALTESAGHAPLARLFHRGEYQQPRDETLPAGLSVVVPEGQRVEFPIDDPAFPTTGRRLALARWLTDPRHPLVARVLVNRVWMHHFGQGLVATPTEFGHLGSPPTHPDLLDWLAAEFISQGWSLKQLQRHIMHSQAWQQSSVPLPAQRALDPDNRYVSRKPLQRLDAEIIRDRMLAASGRLDRAMYGTTLAIKEDEAGQVIVDGSQTRRSLYIRARRSQPVAMLQAFDAPVMDVLCEYRPVSNVATQSLIMLNGEFCLEQAGHMAESIVARLGVLPTSHPTPTPDTGEQDAWRPFIEQAWQRGLCRPPTDKELQAAQGFIAMQLTELASDPRGLAGERTAEQQVLVNLCHTLLNTNEFIVIE